MNRRRPRARQPRRSAPGTRLLAAVWLASVWPTAASAYRPFNSTDAAVTGRGEVEIEFGPLGYLQEGPDRSLVAPSLVVNWGFAERWEAVLEGRHFVQLGGEIRQPRLRLEDTAVSVKHVLRDGGLQGRSGPSVAAELSALLPSFGGGSGAGAEGTLVASQRWADLTVHLNGAAAWTRAHRLGAFGGLVVEGPDRWPVRPVAEVFVEAERDVPTVASGLVGAIWQAREDLSFDAAVRRARAGGFDTTEVRVGLTWAFGVGFPR